MLKIWKSGRIYRCIYNRPSSVQELLSELIKAFQSGWCRIRWKFRKGLNCKPHWKETQGWDGCRSLADLMRSQLRSRQIMTSMIITNECWETYHSHQAEVCRGWSRKRGLKETLATVDMSVRQKLIWIAMSFRVYWIAMSYKVYNDLWLKLLFCISGLWCHWYKYVFNWVV